MIPLNRKCLLSYLNKFACMNNNFNTDINVKDNFIGEETYLKTWIIYLRIIKCVGIAPSKFI